MKKLIAIAAIVIASVTTAQVNAQSKGFNTSVFQKALIKEMTIQFPGFKLDTTLNSVLRAKTQEEANSSVYVMKKGGNANIQKDEKSEELLKELKEKMEARRKQLDLKWEGWEEDERERQGGGMLIVIAFIAGIGVVVGAVIYTLIVLQ